MEKALYKCTTLLLLYKVKMLNVTWHTNITTDVQDPRVTGAGSFMYRCYVISKEM